MAATAPRKPIPKTAARAPAKAAAAVVKPAAKTQARSATVTTKKEATVAAKSTKNPNAPKPAASKPAASTKPVGAASKSNKNGNAAQAAAPKTPKVDLPEKIKKAKLVRDSFTMPEVEYAALSEVKKACLKAGFEVKKSELLRIGVALIRKLALSSLKQEVTALAPLKPGRPRKEKSAEK